MSNDEAGPLPTRWNTPGRGGSAPADPKGRGQLRRFYATPTDDERLARVPGESRSEKVRWLLTIADTMGLLAPKP
jgi:hypothetical protein